MCGSLLKEKAKAFAKELGIEYSASEGWLTNFKKRNGIVFKKMCGESSSVDINVYSKWQNSLSDLIKEHEPPLPEQDLTFDDYVLVDKDIAVWGALSDAEIVALDHNKTESDEDESQELTPVTLSEAKVSLNKLRNFFLQNHVDADILQAAFVLEKFIDKCNNRIVMAQRKHLGDFLRGRIIGRLECGRTQLEVSEELGIAQSVISRLWQRFQDDVTAKRNRRSTASDLFRQLSSATGTTVSRQTVYRRLGHIVLYARRPVRSVPLTATHCHLRLTWSREHALWTPQQWSCVMFSDESRFNLQSDSRRTLIWRAPDTRYQENGGNGWLVWGGIILDSRTDLHVQSVTMTGHIYRDVILEQHVRLFRGTMGAEFLFMDDNARPHRANIVDECLQSEDITRIDWPAYSPDLNPIEHVWDMLGGRIAARQSPSTCLPELRRALLDE
ncbi:transposable element Tcb1 transposase [Trichonephila clavipes]|nr:transposable element Tcb1 transposase [Trichonephila clavipes]